MLSYKIIILFILILILFYILNEINNLKNKVIELEKKNNEKFINNYEDLANIHNFEDLSNNHNFNDLSNLHMNNDMNNLLNSLGSNIFNNTKDLKENTSEHLEIYSNSNDANDLFIKSSSINSDTKILILENKKVNSESISDNKKISSESMSDNKNISSESILSNSKVQSETSTLIDNNIIINNSKNEDLFKLKLIDIKKIAEENNICLTKKVGRTTKYKTKDELINEINKL